MKVRIRFQKAGVMKYVGHLDLMRFFQKAIRRSGIPVKYSQGYNPHQIMSFAAPLGVGITSDGEYMDLELTEAIPSEEALCRLSETMVDGMAVTQFKYLSDDEKNAMASVEAAAYRLSYRDGAAPGLGFRQLQDARYTFYEQARQIPVIKKTKKGERSMDLKPLVYRFDVTETADDGIGYELFLSCGSTDNVKPELLMAQFHRFLGCKEEDAAYCIHRRDMFTLRDGSFVSLGDIGYEI